MSKKNGDSDNKVGGIKSTGRTTTVDQTEAVTGVKQVKATAAVGGVKGIGSVGGIKSTRTMSLAEREQLFKLIDEEYEKLLSSGIVPKTDGPAIRSAVKMALDSGLLPEDEQGATSKKGAVLQKGIKK